MSYTGTEYDVGVDASVLEIASGVLNPTTGDVHYTSDTPLHTLYNRDRNAPSGLSAFSFVPEYGSQVNFEMQNDSRYFYTSDYYYKKIEKGLNSTSISLKLKFSNKTESEAASFLNLLEEVDTSLSGNISFNTADSVGSEIAFPTGSIYKNIKNLYVEDYEFILHNGLFDINLNLYKDGFSPFLDWKGSSYIDTGNFNTGWGVGNSYEKYDVIWYTGDMSTGKFETKIKNKIDYFKYCTSGHISSNAISPTGDISFRQRPWTDKFFFEIDDSVTISQKRSQNHKYLKNSHTIYQKNNANDGLIQGLSLELKNRTNKETKAVIHFLEKHEGYKPFELNLPQLYKKRKFFVVESFNHKFVYRDCNDITINVNEVATFTTDYNKNSFYHGN